MAPIWYKQMDLTIELLHLVGDSTDIDSCNSWRMKFIDQQDVSKLIDLINNMVNQDEKEQLQQCSSSSSSIHAPPNYPSSFHLAITAINGGPIR
ncbi:hypothetical protein PSHT_12820 [Puccinia striiformis]|uniref:Uncharacterized protein n=3 Tax=Puccinia striiformis TaxID=27350 RepID=A0A0L0VSS6_9BASI|nr:hypothetical protein PSTG_04538 [Puccinia striiformis f. sp. tritici PST-78]POW00821.1 hypothetical protein PSHT_12820 [Puccinia striiformis]POW01504.1 hypothetical protein PSTT_12416 [Puccinia striiformis]